MTNKCRLRHRTWRTMIASICLASAAPAIAQPAMTPPMGWNAWNAFRTDVDEAKILANADVLIQSGLAEAGYRHVNIDDGWWLKRAADGRIHIRAGIFPSARLADGSTSFRPFVDGLHAKGLKAGIYTDIGRNNCAQHWDRNSQNLPAGDVREREVGTLGFQQADARLLLNEWGFDYLKVDACGIADYGPGFAGVRDGIYRELSPLIVRGKPDRSEPAIVEALYATFAAHVRAAAPDAVLAICAWGEAEVGNWAGQYGQSWRTSPDIRATWASMLANFDSAAPRALFAGPGRWNDPDMLEIGNGDFDATHLVEARAHLSMWAIIAAPLILSVDLTKASPEVLAIVGNREVIAIDQDPAGHQGVILTQTADGVVVAKQLTTPGHKAIAMINRSDKPLTLGVEISDLRLRPDIEIRDVWRARTTRLKGPRIEMRLAPRETALLRVQGQVANPRMVHAEEMPAQIKVAATDTRPAGRDTWIPARIGHTPSGVPIVVDGRHDVGALGVSAGTRLRVSLAGDARRFHTRPIGGGRYAIYGDGKLLRQGVADGRSSINLAVGNVRMLELVAPVDASEGFAWSGVGLER